MDDAPQAGTTDTQRSAVDRSPEDTLRALLDVLVPDDRALVIQDAAGNEYPVPRTLPMRRQIPALRAVERLLGDPAIARAVGAFAAARGDGDEVSVVSQVGRLADVLFDVVDTEAFATGLDQAFSAAYPDILAAARGKGDPAGRPTDLFPVEDLVGAMVPFSKRLVGTIVEVFTQVGATL